MIVQTVRELHELTKGILIAAGADQRNAERVAEALVSANLCGVDTHGVWRIPEYVADIQAGDIAPTAWPTVLTETSSSALVGGNWTFGHVAAKYAMDLTMEKATAQGVAVSGVVQTHHIGRLGEYVEMAVSQGLIAFVWAGGQAEDRPVAVPYGGRRAVLQTNPLAIGFPAGDEPPIVIDYATTVVAGAKVRLARDRHEQLAPGCIVDKDGHATTDPAAFFEGGAHLPFGGHKGYALMLAAEFLGRIFSGSDLVTSDDRGGPVFRRSGTTMIVCRADLFQPYSDYVRRADEMERRVRAVPPAPGFTEVLVPGDLEARARATRRRDGIPIPDDVWQKLVGLAGSLGVSTLSPHE